ncbi:MAG: nucleoside recognition domain-containing protein [Clostridia bacterium]
MNGIFVFMISIGIAVSIITGDASKTIDSMVNGAAEAVTLCLKLTGAHMLWMGFMQVAKDAGLIEGLARIMKRPLSKLFPKAEKAIAPITLNLAANFFGMGNAATPFGLAAMKEMQKLNTEPQRATNDMVMFLSLNSAAIEFLPTGILALLTATGAKDPYNIVIPTFLASIVSFISAIAICKLFEKWGKSKK